MFEITMHFKYEMIGIWQRFNRNFELTVFEFNRARPVKSVYFNTNLTSLHLFVGLNVEQSERLNFTWSAVGILEGDIISSNFKTSMTNSDDDTLKHIETKILFRTFDKKRLNKKICKINNYHH